MYFFAYIWNAKFWPILARFAAVVSQNCQISGVMSSNNERMQLTPAAKLVSAFKMIGAHLVIRCLQKIFRFLISIYAVTLFLFKLLLYMQHTRELTCPCCWLQRSGCKVFLPEEVPSPRSLARPCRKNMFVGTKEHKALQCVGREHKKEGNNGIEMASNHS